MDKLKDSKQEFDRKLKENDGKEEEKKENTTTIEEQNQTSEHDTTTTSVDEDDLNNSIYLDIEEKINIKMEVRLPSVLKLDGNLSENWKRFKAQFENYMIAAGIDDKSSKVKTATLLNIAGDEAYSLFETLNIADEDKGKYDVVVAAFEKYCTPQKNIIYERFVFYKRQQLEGEKFDHFFTDIKKLAKSCEFGDQENSLIRDRIVLGVHNSELQEVLVRSAEAELEKIVTKCRLFEMNSEQTKEIQQNGHGSSVYEINGKNQWNKRMQQQQQQIAVNSKKSKNADSSGKIKNCSYCGYEHKKGACPAYGKRCKSCNRMNHFSNCCRNRNVNEIDTDLELVENCDEMQIYSLELINEIHKVKSWFSEFCVENVKINFKLDTGSHVNILPLVDLKKMNIDFNANLKETKVILEAFGGFKLKPIGMINLVCCHGNLMKKFNFIVLDGDVKPILGLEGCVELGLIKRLENCGRTIDNVEEVMDKKEFIEKNKDVFTGLGTLKIGQKLELKEGAKPVSKPPRRIPLHLMDRVKLKLEEMEQQGIIERVTEAPDWVHNLVVVEKPDGSLRVCLDPNELNKVLKKNGFLAPTIEEISEKFKDARWYTVLDLKDGFYQIRLDQEASKMCTFNTPFGCFRFLCFPFGLCTGPDLCQGYNYEHFGNLEGVVIYMDDLCIYGRTRKEHDRRLNRVLEVARAVGVKFNERKVQYAQSEIHYIGHIFSENGRRVDPDRIEAVTHMENPKNVKELQRFLGMINYMRSFLPNLATITAPLRELLKKDVCWHWTRSQQEAMDKLKILITSTPVLQAFDVTAEVVVQCDASKDGVGFCLLQNGKPVAYGSRSLTDAQRNYGQIEKEFLAILMACEKFHQYIYGKRITVQTDHRPLVSIMAKNLSQIHSYRLQRIKLKLMRYIIDMKYVPGKYLHIADHLSRSFLRSQREYLSLNQVVHTVSVTSEKLVVLKGEIAKDAQLMQITKLFKEGWPSTINLVPENVKYFFKFRNEIYVDNGIVFLNNQIIIPKSMRAEMVEKAHAGHFGINRTVMRAKSVMWWPNMERDIEEFVGKCRICEKFQQPNKKEAMIPHQIPDSPFLKIGCDFCDFGGKSFLIIKDYFSKWLEIIETKGKTAEEVIEKWKGFFAHFGVPRTIIADFQPFGSFKCKQFAREYDIEIRNSSPYYPRSNGMAESAVKTAKNILRKANEGGLDLTTLVMEYLNTPVPELKKSPFQIVFARQVRTLLPVADSSLKNKMTENVKIKLNQVQRNTEKFYNRTATKTNKQFNNGENVTLLQNSQWNPARILQATNHPRSYMVQDEQGKIKIRNQIHLKRSNSEFKKKSRFLLNCYDNISSKRNNNNLTNDSGSHNDLVINDTTNLANNSSNELNNNQESHVNDNNLNGNNYVTRFGRSVKQARVYDPRIGQKVYINQ